MTVTLESLFGRVADVDSHEQIPHALYPKVFGERGQRFLDANPDIWKRLERAYPETELTKVPPDTGPITEEIVWTVKRTHAPSSMDIDRRVAVLDAMGIKRQLVFPTMGLIALSAAHGGGFNGVPKSTPEQMRIGSDALEAYNEWAGHYTNKYTNRLRIVGVLETTDDGLTPEELVRRAESLISTGVKAVMIPTGMPPAGVSPAHPALDNFYTLLTETNTTLVVHPPSGAGFRKTDVWGLFPGTERDVSFATAIHQAEENYLTVMIMGGVFERHPKLRFGIIENGASWIGPIAERLDTAACTNPSGARRGNGGLTMKPSEYMARQVRASVLLHEPVEVWLERYPSIQNCFCYSSDYPHVEGGQWSMREFFRRIKPLGDEVIEKFFVTNPGLLLQ